MLRTIFGPKGGEVVRGWRRLYNKEPHNLYSSPSIIGMIKSKRLRWAGHAAGTGHKRHAYGVLVRRPEG
jgi:hypothetical protein